MINFFIVTNFLPSIENDFDKIRLLLSIDNPVFVKKIKSFNFTLAIDSIAFQ